MVKNRSHAHFIDRPELFINYKKMKHIIIVLSIVYVTFAEQRMYFIY